MSQDLDSERQGEATPLRERIMGQAEGTIGDGPTGEARRARTGPIRWARPAARWIIVGAAVAVAVVLVLIDPFILPPELPEGMSVAAPQRCLAVFVVCMSLWFTNVIPVAATGLLAIALLPMLGVLETDQAFSKFGNGAVFFMLGVFLLAAGCISTGLSKRLTLLALQRFDQSPGRLIMGVAVSASFLALLMPEHAVAAMIYPIVVEIVDALRLPQGHKYAKKLFLALAWGSIIGGVGTFLGGARAPLALSLLRQHYPDQSISFLGWMAAAIPLVIIMTVVVVLTLRRHMKDELEEIRSATAMLDDRVRRLGPMSVKERRLAVLGGLTILAWITLGQSVDLAVISITSATLLFLLRIVTWNQAQSYVHWGVLVMYGGAVAIGQSLTETQAMSWIAGQFLGPGIPAFAVVAIMATAAILLTETISNAAAVAILLPVGYSLCDAAGIDPITMTLAVTIASGLAFMLPIGSPPTAISFSAGHYSVRETIQIGWHLNILALLAIFVLMAFWWPVLGMARW